MFLFILPQIVFPIDENYFENMVSQCVCAVKPNECNPYCSCDPFCTNEQKKNFSFYLPESFNNNKISCDPNNRISKVNLNSIKEELPNCYSIKGKENGKKIENYKPLDFHIDHFSEAVESPFYEESFNYTNTTYTEKQIIIGSAMNNIQNFYMPISVGSSAFNALIPIRFKMNLPEYSCIITNSNPIDFITSIAFVQYVLDPPGKEEIAEYDLFKTLRNEVRRNRDKVLNIQYIFQTDDNYTTITNVTMKRADTISVKDAPAGYLYFTSRVYFGPDSLIDQDTKYFTNDMGYYYGTPIMIENASSDSIFTDKRIPLRYNSNDVLFGVNTTILLPLNESKLNSEGELKEQIFPHFEGIYKSFGYVILESNGFEYLLPYQEIEPKKRNNLGIPIADWNFYYKEFSLGDVRIFLLQKYNQSLRYNPKNLKESKIAMINIKFFEIDDKGELKVDEEIRFHSHSYSTLFDFLFRDTSESLETIGLLFCFAIIGTIWCWYSCFFYIED